VSGSVSRSFTGSVPDPLLGTVPVLGLISNSETVPDPVPDLVSDTELDFQISDLVSDL
jgi:hypothetical protein